MIELCSDKLATFRRLSELGFVTPRTIEVETVEELRDITYPCVVKPPVDSGGSSFVFLVRDRDEAASYFTNLRSNGKRCLYKSTFPRTRASSRSACSRCREVELSDRLRCGGSFIISFLC